MNNTTIYTWQKTVKITTMKTRTTQIIIRCIFYSIFIGWEPNMWPANNCLQIMVHSCVIPSKSVFAANNILLKRNSNHALVVAPVWNGRSWSLPRAVRELTSLLDQKNSDTEYKESSKSSLKRIQRLSESKRDSWRFPCNIERQVGNCSEGKSLRWSQKKEWRTLHQSFTCRDTLWPSAVLQLTQDWYHKDPEFSEANTAYPAEISEIKREVKAHTQKEPAINKHDIKKLYESELFN